MKTCLSILAAATFSLSATVSASAAPAETDFPETLPLTFFDVNVTGSNTVLISDPAPFWEKNWWAVQEGAAQKGGSEKPDWWVAGGRAQYELAVAFWYHAVTKLGPKANGASYDVKRELFGLVRPQGSNEFEKRNSVSTQLESLAALPVPGWASLRFLSWKPLGWGDYDFRKHGFRMTHDQRFSVRVKLPTNFNPECGVFREDTGFPIFFKAPELEHGGRRAYQFSELFLKVPEPTAEKWAKAGLRRGVIVSWLRPDSFLPVDGFSLVCRATKSAIYAELPENPGRLTRIASWVEGDGTVVRNGSYLDKPELSKSLPLR